LLITTLCRNELDTFYKEKNQRFLFVPETLKMSVEAPSKLPKSKLCVFLKTEKEVTPKNFPVAILSTELGGKNAFENLYQLANTVFLPMIGNSCNQQKWGELTSREVNDRFHSFLSSVAILCGQVKGETLLPMPPPEKEFSSKHDVSTTSKNRISILEKAIATWTKQIKNILKQDPEALLKRNQHPTPDVEIEFWRSKSNNLNSVFEQLQSQRMRRVLRALDEAKSTYCTAFARLCKDVYIARLEANDNTKYLQILESWFEKLVTMDDFPRLSNLFVPILHALLLVWRHSNYYNTPSRLVIIIREICNAIIEQACRYVSGEQIFALIDSDESTKAIEQIRATYTVCESFKIAYFEYKRKAAEQCPGNPWKIQNNAIFSRLDLFLERCHEALEITKTIIHFSKLSKVEIGGTKGSVLTNTVHQIYNDFEECFEKIKTLDYDIMYIDAVEFEQDFRSFRAHIEEFERRLGTLISVAVEDCSTVYGGLQLFNLFDSELLRRTIIQDELESKYVSIIESYSADLKNVQEIFVTYKEDPPKEHSKNLPPISRALTWCRSLIARINLPMQNLQKLGRGIIDREEAKEVIKMHSTILDSLKNFEEENVKLWGSNVKSISDSKLMLPLLCRDPKSRELSTNFDPALTMLLREVKYFLNLGIHVPDSALSIYKSTEVFRSWIGNIDLIVNMNNSILNEMLPVERPLIAPYLIKFDNVVEKGLEELSWRSDGVEEFITESMKHVKIVHGLLKTITDNFRVIDQIISKWNVPMFTRKSKPIDREEFEHSIKSTRTTRFTEIKESGKRVHSLLKDTNKALRISNTSVEWRAYVDFINCVVIEGLSKCIVTSLDMLFSQVNSEVIAKEKKLPLIEVKLTLTEENLIAFSPSLGHSCGKDDSINSMVESLIGGFMQVSTLFKRLDSEGSYIRDMHSDLEVNRCIAFISESIASNEHNCMLLKNEFEVYAHLWDTDIQTHFEKFRDKAFFKTEKGTTLLNLQSFDEAIDSFDEIKKSVSKVKSPTDVGWLRINTTPIKLEVTKYANKWKDTYTTFLLQSVVETMQTLHLFMEEVKKGLDRAIAEGPQHQDTLMAVMSDIRDVRKKIEYVSEIMEPQRECVSILKKHGVDIFGSKIAGKNIQDYLEEVPLAWEAVVKKTFQKKEEILPLQIASVEALKSDLDRFYLSIREFRGNFRSKAPFKIIEDSTEAYNLLISYSKELDKLDKKVEEYHELEELFELQHATYPEIGETRTEIFHLQILWDFKSMLSLEFKSWLSILWRDVDTDALEDKNKKLRKMLKEKGNSYQSMKGWQIYKDIEESLVIMSTELPLVADLHSNAMRPRHWSSLARVCNVKAVDPTRDAFSLDDIISLKLHKHKAEIEEIVETAMKELKIENKLVEIESIWEKTVLDYIPHKDTEMYVPRPSEEVIENMEAHQMELQGIFGMGKFMEYFYDRVVAWQTNLRTVDDTLRMWTFVSRSWASLESIFLASADIRAQLPDDTKRFEGIDSDFKDLMKECVTESHCLTVCSKEGRYELLKSMLQRLELCQKSLNEYLDIKKKIFPRFYFVSAVALLDMLANGTNPSKIMPYLGDCYDALANLNFVILDNGEKSDRATDMMIAKDGETAPLFEIFVMEG